ncbi:MAG: glycoside hydrolase TIM-barrel-like domain-containing protein [Paracoccaceae bacterium]
MATIVLSAVGASIGAGFGGSVLGLSGAVIGRAVGATLGRVIDQRLLGPGSEVVETGKVDRFRLSGASEGAPIAHVFGRVRISGQVIWATRFQENVTETTSGGKGAPRPQTTTVEYSYSVSLAVALCEGEITRVGRIWADGVEMSRDDLNLRVYNGSETQQPDPKISAVEGAGDAPSYRGIAYVVIEDLELGQFGNRVPQFSFEVLRPAQGDFQSDVPDLVRGVRGVAMIPGTGEYALAATPVHYSQGPGINTSANVNTPSGKTDLVTSVEMLDEELPRCGSVSLVVSWFGNDLRCSHCSIRPMVEQSEYDGAGMAWQVSGVSRSAAQEVPRIDNRPVYGGTPADRSVIEAIGALRDAGKAVMYYPFILMTQQIGNGLPDPWSGADDQPRMPWRGRITLNAAPGQPGSTDQTAAAASEVAAFFGTAQASDFTVSGDTVSYSGPNEWSYRRFILHNAALAKAAGGVDAFCIGSEMVALTTVRGAAHSFPAVTRLKALAADVRQILGPGCKPTYAADWLEYFGFNDGAGSRYFHLDSLGRCQYRLYRHRQLCCRTGATRSTMPMPIGSNLQPNYLKANIEGGEGFDWYHSSPEGEAAQNRVPITDDAYGEPWVWRYKDLRSWWQN